MTKGENDRIWDADMMDAAPAAAEAAAAAGSWS